MIISPNDYEPLKIIREAFSLMREKLQNLPLWFLFIVMLLITKKQKKPPTMAHIYVKASHCYNQATACPLILNGRNHGELGGGLFAPRGK